MKGPIRQLTNRHRSVLYLRAFGMDYEEIADALNINRRTVANRLAEVANAQLPGLEGLPGSDNAERMVYVLGLLDAGVPPTEVRERLAKLLRRAREQNAAVGRAGIAGTGLR